MLAAAAPPLAFLAVAFVWPLAAVTRRALSTGALAEVLTDPGLRSVAWFTLWQAALSTALTMAVALPMAGVLARYRFPGRALVQAVVTVPFVLPTVVVGAAFLAVLPVRWHGTVAAILLAHVFFNYAVVVRVVGALWQHLDPRLDEAARMLGAPPWRVFTDVTLPLLRPALVAAASVVFLFTFTSFGAVLLLGGPRHPTLEVEIYRLTVARFDLPAAAAVALLQLAFLAALLGWWTWSQGRHARALRLRPASTSRPPRTRGERLWVTGNLAVAVLLLGIPLARLVQRSLQVGEGYGLAWWRLLDDRASTLGAAPLDALATSLRTAAVATAAAVVLGGLAAVAVAASGRLGRVLDTGLMLPLGTSAVTAGFGLLLVSGRLGLRGSWVLVPLAHALVALPFVVRTALPVLRSIDPRQREAAALLGASRWWVWWTVDRAALVRPLLVGAGFAFAVSMGEFGATAFLARRGTPTLPVAITDLLGRPGAANAGQAYALAVLLAVVVTAVVLVVERARRDGDGFW